MSVSFAGYWLVRSNARDLDRRGITPPRWLWWIIMGPAFIVVAGLGIAFLAFVASFAGFELFG